MDGLMVVSGRRHNADDIVATALAVEPMKFVYRGRIAVFSVSVLHDERIVIVAEQRPDSTEEDSFQWMSRVLQAIDSIHQVGVYCLALVPANTLPKTPLGGIHLSETKQLFLEGALHPCNVLMCPHTCVTNLPKPRQKQPEIGPASVMVGNLVSGKRIAQASGRDLGQIEDNDQARKGTIANSLTCVQLHKRAEKIAVMLMERGIDLIAAFYGCLYAGCVPITVRPPHPQNIATTLPTVKMIVEVSRSACLMTTQLICKLLRSREAAAAVDVRTWPPILDTDDLPKKRPPQIFKPSNPDMLAYLDFSVSTTGMLAGVKKLQFVWIPIVDWDLSFGASVGHQSILIPPSELETTPALWLLAVSQYKVRDTFCSYSVMELCTKGLGSQTESLKRAGFVRGADMCGCGRRTTLNSSDTIFFKAFKDLGLHPRAVSTSFGCRVNLAICLQCLFRTPVYFNSSLRIETTPALWLLAVSQYKLCTKGLGSQTESLKARGLDLSRVRTCVVVAEERPRIALTQSFSKLFKDLGLHPRAVSTSFGCRVNLAICLQ
ncbi:hypothetical protein E2320_001579, partial [Naja naja]